MFSVALLLCRGTWLIELVEKLGLRPPLFLFEAPQPGYAMVWSVLQKNSGVGDVSVVSYECINVLCSMPIAVIGNALTIVSLDQSNCCFFAPFEAGITPGNTRDFCEFCTTLPVPGTSASSVRSFPYLHFLFSFCL